jgi:DNA-binding transcriptional ArsR family regulator
MELNQDTNIDQRELKISAEVLRALAHPLRMRILEFIDRNKEINVNKIYSTLDLEQSITSQHLRILRSAGLVDTERNGKFIYYSLRYGKLINTKLAVERFLLQQ